MEIKNVYKASEISLKPVSEGVERKILAHSENLMVCELHFKKGAIGALHSHFHEQSTYIISGKFEFDLGGRKVVVEAGDCLYKQPDLVHGCVCLEDGVLIDIFTPERKDFLS